MVNVDDGTTISATTPTTPTTPTANNLGVKTSEAPRTSTTEKPKMTTENRC